MKTIALSRPWNVRSESNHLYFSGPIGDDVLPVAAALHNLVHKQGYKDVILDFQRSGYLDPKFMLPLVATARLYRIEEVDFELVEPEDLQSARMLQNTNWAHLIWPEKYDARDDRNQMHLFEILGRQGKEMTCHSPPPWTEQVHIGVFRQMRRKRFAEENV